MSPRTYRSAIVGTGAIAGAHATAVIGSAGRGELVAAVDLDGERARAFAREHGVPRTFASLDDLLAGAQVDLVHLCTPPASHAGLALACLARGVTVLVEKPPTLSVAELDGLAEAERASGAHLATVFQHRFGPAAVRLRRLTAAGELGRPLLATCATQWYRNDDYYAVPWRGKWRTEGGGPTMGHGIHQFDLLLSVLGPWREVTALAARRSRPVDTEDVSMALVTFDSGAVASVVNSVVSPRQVSELRFDYERATVELRHLYGYRDDDWTVTPAPGCEPVWTAGRTDLVSGHDLQLAAVYDALDAGRPPPVTTADARRTMEFIAALYASAFTGERVRSGRVPPAFLERMDGTGAPWAAA